MSTETVYFENSEYAALQPGKPIRLLPFGTLVKNGKKRTITPEMAGKFRLPHFKPPVKLGSHDDPTPAGGFITNLFVGPDGLYGELELTDKGARAITDGDYRYHSPEIVWEGGGLENPVTGDVIAGPLIVGDALLHTPHLGESAALYTVEVQELQPMNESEIIEELEEVTAPAGFWEKFTALFRRAEATVEIEQEQEDMTEETLDTGIDADAFAAMQQERDYYAAEIAAMKAEQAAKERVERFTIELAETKAPADLAPLLAGLTDEQAAPIVQAFKALSAQIDANLTTELGSAGEGTEPEPMARIQQLINQKIGEGMEYGAAFKAARVENAALFAEVYK